MWSKKHDSCIECGTTETAHQSRGLCRNCYMRLWRKENPESSQRSREKAKESRKAYQKEYNQRDYVKVANREKTRRYKERYPERVKETQKKNYEKNKEKRQAYYQRPEVKARYKETVLRRRFGENAVIAYRRDGGLCRKCGGDNKVAVHHIDRDQTNDELENLICLCNICHGTVHLWVPKILRVLLFDLWMEGVDLEDDVTVMERLKSFITN